MEQLLSIILGISLSAACGFRVFVPLLVMSTAARYNQMPLSKGYEWLGSDTAFYIFVTATIFEIAAYYVPWVDNMLDTIAAPASVVAGTFVTASVIPDMDPMFKWTLAAVAGGGSAGVVQGATTLLRAASTAVTGGVGNSAVSTAETSASAAIAVSAVFVPIFAGIIVISTLLWACSKIFGWIKRKFFKTAQSTA